MYRVDNPINVNVGYARGYHWVPLADSKPICLCSGPANALFILDKPAVQCNGLNGASDDAKF